MIKLENVTKKFPSQSIPAVSNLNLEIKEGEICVLVGPSGCGKTTTMKMINRLINPTKGKIYVNGQDTDTVNHIKLRREIGYVIQEIGLFPHMTIEQNVATVPKEKGWSKEKIKKRTAEMLKLVGLDPDEFGKRYPSALSGGQRQRVGVGRALASDPPVLLMDEPFAAVDPITRARLQNEFLRILQRLNKTIIFVTHDIDEAIKMGDKIAVLRDGELVQHTTPDELLSAPANEFVSRLVGKNRSIKRLHLIRIREILEKADNEWGQGQLSTAELKEKVVASRSRSIMIVDEKNELLGMVSAKDLKEKHGNHAKDFIEEVPDTVTDDATLNDALSVMLEIGEGFVAVVDENNRYQGTLTLNDLLEQVRGDNGEG